MSRISLSLFPCLFVLLVLYGCDVPVAGSPLGPKGCGRCHQVELDPAHRFKCTRCHRGNPRGRTMEDAHRGLVSMPASPWQMDSRCGGCHPKAVEAARKSLHYTLSGEIGQVWSRFFPGSPVPSPAGLSAMDRRNPRAPEALVADLLVRRCLRCHVYYRGDDYRLVRRGTGCAACHMRFPVSGPWDHRFYREVPDHRCLSCHYGNFVGWDYYGRFEKDYEDEYRAPLRKGRHLERPYGLEWMDMTKDVHKRHGYTCTDCHRKGPCSGQGTGAVSCLSCHSGRGPGPGLDENVAGHRAQDVKKVSCAACHALWAFIDRGRFLTRQDAPDLEFWEYLACQGSSEVEGAVLGGMASMPAMTDKFTGRPGPGLWFQGFYFRRWAPVVLGETGDGRLEVLRPLLELYLSYVDAKGDVVFDNMVPEGMDRDPWVGWLPYVPHTIGKADTFRTLEVERWLSRRGSTR